MILNFLDLETTGLSQAKGDRIIEICMILADSETEKEIGRFVRRINPERSIAPKAQEVHGISIEDLEGEPVWGGIAPTVSKIMDKSDVLIAHNLDFDGPFVVGELMRAGFGVPDVKTFCTMEAARWATPQGKLPTLQELCWALGVDYDPEKAHSASYDVEVMMESFFRATRVGKFNMEDI